MPGRKISLYVLCYSLLLGFMKNADAPLWKGFFYATLMFLLSCLQSLFNHQYMYTCFTVGMRVKTAVMGLVYRKVSKYATCTQAFASRRKL